MKHGYLDKSALEKEDVMGNEMLEIKNVSPETDPRDDSSEMERSPSLLGRGMLDRSTQLFREIVNKVGRIGKDSYLTALSSISVSKRAGKTTVLKMEIISRKRKMKEFFNKLGEMVYSTDGGRVANVSEDVSIRALLDTIRSHEQEIKEIEQYIASLGSEPSLERNGNVYPLGLEEPINVERTIDDSINEPDDIQVDSERRAMVTGMLRGEERAAALSAYVDATKDEDAEARIGALKQLFKFDGSEVIPHLVNALRDKDVEVRRRAALYLGWKVAVSAVHPLIVVTKDRNPSVRKASLDALGELGVKEAIPALIKGLDDRDYDVRKAAYKSLTKVTSEFIEFNAKGPLSDRFRSMQKWKKWWSEAKK